MKIKLFILLFGLINLSACETTLNKQPKIKENHKDLIMVDKILANDVKKIQNEILTSEKLTAEKPTTEKPTTEIPTTEKPTTEIPTTEKPTTEIPTTEKPTTEIPTTEKPTTEIPTTEISTTENLTNEKTATRKLKYKKKYIKKTIITYYASNNNNQNSQNKNSQNSQNKNSQNSQNKNSQNSQNNNYNDKLISLNDFLSKGVVFWGGNKFTYYSQSVLPGGGLSIPGRHVNKDGYISDQNGYIVLAGSAPKGTVYQTPFGYLGKIYDRGTVGNHLDVYIR